MKKYPKANNETEGPTKEEMRREKLNHYLKEKYNQHSLLSFDSKGSNPIQMIGPTSVT